MRPRQFDLFPSPYLSSWICGAEATSDRRDLLVIRRPEPIFPEVTGRTGGQKMVQKAPSTRRDPRIAVSGGAGSVEFDSQGPGGGRRRGELTEVSVSGVTFELEAGPGFKNGEILPGATLHISDCIVEGQLLVKHSEPIRKARVEVGCLFYPS